MGGKAHISFTPAAYARAVVSYLTHVGAPAHDLLRRVHAPEDVLQDDIRLVPLTPFLRLLHLAESELGMADVGIQTSLFAGSVTGAWSTLEFPYSLGAFVQKSAQHQNQTTSGARFWIDWDDEHLLFNWLGLDDVAGRSQADGYILAQSVSMIRRFTSPEWTPPCARLRCRSPDARAFSAALDCEIRPHAVFNSLPIPMTLLGRRPTVKTVSGAAIGGPRPPEDIVAQVRLFIAASLADQAATLQNAADAAGVSRRTLQRLLQQRGFTFAQLIESVRIHSARQLLTFPDASVIDVALQLGYADPSNFTRAFRRHVGTPPSQWRRLAGLATQN